jgi:hypothetical protein
MDPQIEELLGLEAVRTRAHVVLKLAEEGRLNHFNYHSERMEDATDYVLKLIQVGLAHHNNSNPKHKKAHIIYHSVTSALTSIT